MATSVEKAKITMDREFFRQEIYGFFQLAVALLHELGHARHGDPIVERELDRLAIEIRAHEYEKEGVGVLRDFLE